MQVMKFDALTQHHTIRLPRNVPDGVVVHVSLVWESEKPAHISLKQLFVSVVEGLQEDDLARPRDMGREIPEWLI